MCMCLCVLFSTWLNLLRVKYSNSGLNHKNDELAQINESVQHNWLGIDHRCHRGPIPATSLHQFDQCV